jgi:glycosyltransferase involved in cell wall biosynthesis
MRVAFLAHSFHLTYTKSTRFLIELLQRNFESVSVILHEDAWKVLPRSDWDLLVIFQKLYPAAELEAFGIPRVVLVPMWDDCPKEKEFWIRYSDFRVLCFSSTLKRMLDGWGLRTFGAKYFPSVASQQRATFDGSLRGFFWPRTPQLTWGVVSSLIGATQFKSFHYHRSTNLTKDDGSVPRETDHPGMNLTVTSWFESQEDYLRAVQQNNIYFAARRNEGIGMSFLEALALGMCVVAPDSPTMNEYIVHGENGLLFDPDKPGPIDFSLAARLGERAARASAEGRTQWETSIPRIIEFLRIPDPGSRKKKHLYIRMKRRLRVWMKA